MKRIFYTNPEHTNAQMEGFAENWRGKVGDLIRLGYLDKSQAIEPWKTEDELNQDLIQEYTLALDLHLDSQAISKGYDSIKTAVTYADESAVLRFQDEGKAFRAWRSLCYDHGYKVLDDWQNARIPQPTIEEFIAGLPVLNIVYTEV